MLFAVISMVAVLLWLLYEWAEHALIQYNTTDVECDKLKATEVIKICLITDLHNNRCNLKKISKRLKEYAPDVILLAGDMTNKYTKKQPHALKFLRMLTEIAPVFYSLGNHEERMRTETPFTWIKYVRQLPCGVQLLDNHGVEVSVREMNLRISGLSLPEQFYKKGSLYTKDKDLPELSMQEDMFHILLAHQPEYAEWYEKYKPDLVVSGHLHGGLLRLPGIGGVLSPRFRKPKEDAGIYKYPYGSLFVSRGIGSHTIPLRFFNRAEINYLNLYQKSEKVENESWESL